MDRVTKKYYKCYSCAHLITHVRTEHMIDGACVPDQSNCDFSTYDYRIEGGKLFLIRSTVKERTELEETLEGLGYSPANGDVPVGGVCNDCLDTQSMKNLVAASRLEFAAAEAF